MEKSYPPFTDCETKTSQLNVICHESYPDLQSPEKGRPAYSSERFSVRTVIHQAWLQTAGHDQENPSGRPSGEPFPPTPTSWGWAVWGGEALALELHLRMQDTPHAPSTPGLRFQPPCHPGFSPLGRVGDACCTHWAVFVSSKMAWWGLPWWSNG